MHLETRGNVAIVELDGDYSRDLPDGSPNVGPRQAVAEAYFAAQSDAADFLIIFSSFEFDTADADAFYIAVQNDVAGIGLPVFDHSAAFGGPSLQGYIDMGALDNWALDSVDPAHHRLLAAMSHELMHRWCCYVSYLDSSGSESDALLGRDGSHWSFLLDSDASVMYGNDWQETLPGLQRSVANNLRWSELDRYLAGILPEPDVPPFDLILAQEDPARLPEVGVELSAGREAVSVVQVFGAEGYRKFLT